MRDIKFRAWLKNDESMCGWVDVLNSCIGAAYFFASDDVDLMQFTGLKDKDGVDIYEGDIINDDLIGLCQVVYNEAHAAFKVLHKNKMTAKWFVDYLPNEFKYLKVIGNIHENPELLEK